MHWLVKCDVRAWRDFKNFHKDGALFLLLLLLSGAFSIMYRNVVQDVVDILTDSMKNNEKEKKMKKGIDKGKKR